MSLSERLKDHVSSYGVGDLMAKAEVLEEKAFEIICEYIVASGGCLYIDCYDCPAIVRKGECDYGNNVVNAKRYLNGERRER